MRDPDRIAELLDLVNQIWLKNPDLRFNQLIYILQGGYSHNNDGVGQVKGPEVDGMSSVGYDLFSLEDDLFIKHLHAIAADKEGQ